MIRRTTKSRRPNVRRHRRVLGVITPGGMLTKEGAMRSAGLGQHSIQRGEDEGALDPFLFANRLYYETDEILAWIRKSGVRLSKSNIRRKQIGT